MNLVARAGAWIAPPICGAWKLEVEKRHSGVPRSGKKNKFD